MACSYCRSDNWDDWDEDADPPALPQLSALKVPAAAAAPADKFAGEDEGVDEPNHAVPQTQKVRSRHHVGCSAWHSIISLWVHCNTVLHLPLSSQLSVRQCTMRAAPSTPAWQQTVETRSVLAPVIIAPAQAHALHFK